MWDPVGMRGPIRRTSEGGRQSPYREAFPMTRRIITIAAAALLAPVVGCANEVGAPTQFDKPDGSTKEEAEEWSSSDAPSLFGPSLKYALTELPRSGGPQVAPWAESYWPTYEDSINYKWDGASSESAPA